MEEKTSELQKAYQKNKKHLVLGAIIMVAGLLLPLFGGSTGRSISFIPISAGGFLLGISWLSARALCICPNCRHSLCTSLFRLPKTLPERCPQCGEVMQKIRQKQ